MADNGGNAPTEESSLLKGPDKKLPKSTYFSDATLVEIILLCLAILTSCLWLINLLFSGISTLMVIGTLSTLLTISKSLAQQKEIVNIELLQSTEAGLNEELLKLQRENKNLLSQVNSLRDITQEIEKVDKSLTMIESTRKSSADDFFKQVNRNREILESYRNSLATGRSEIFTFILLKADSNGDMFLNETEINKLCGDIDGLTGSNVDKEMIQTAIRSTNGNMKTLMSSMNQLLKKTVEK